MPASSSAQSLYDRERPRRRPAPDWGGDELFETAPRRRFARVVEEDELEARRVPEPAPASPTPPAPRPRLRLVEPPAPAVSDLAAARRTVTITGRPDRALDRPRAGTVEQRIRARPDRLAAWAFALGILLIVIAIATSG